MKNGFGRNSESMLQLGAKNASGYQLGADVVNQRAHRCKCASVDVIVIDYQPKMVFKPCNEGNDGHRIQLWDGTQQGRFQGKSAASPVQAQHLFEQADDFLFYLQLGLPK